MTNSISCLPWYVQGNMMELPGCSSWQEVLMIRKAIWKKTEEKKKPLF